MQELIKNLLNLLENRFKICSTPLRIKLFNVPTDIGDTGDITLYIEEGPPGQYLVHGRRSGGGYIGNYKIKHQLPERIEFETTLSELLSTEGVVIYKGHEPYYDFQLDFIVEEKDIIKMFDSVNECMLQEDPKMILIRQYLYEVIQRYTDIFILHTFYGESYDELGRRLGLTRQRVYQICRNCQKKLNEARETKSKPYQKLKSELF